MLNILSTDAPERKRRLFADFDPRGRTWVVSDLQSKWHLQKELLTRDGVLEQSCVMRATELWRALSFQVQPDVKLLSPELAQTLFWNWIEPMKLPWAKSPHAVPVVLNQMQMWMTIFSDPRHEEIMPQWFQDNPESYVRWGHWFELSSEIWRRCREERLMMVAWLPAMLLSHDLGELHWTRALTFDLGPQVSQVEGQLIKELARHFDVTLIFPEAPWLPLMKNTLRPYDDLLPEPYRGDADWQPSVKEGLSFGRFSTQLAEVKDAVARVRRWLEAGVPAQQIALVAPDVEAYWPALQLYLDQEGIAACKPLTARLGSYLEMAQWAASLRTALKSVSSADLEVHLFAHPHPPRLAFDDFKVLFTHVYDAVDLGRAGQLFERLTAPDLRRAISLPDFLAWALGHWDADQPTERLLALLQVVGQEVPADLELLPAQWLGYCEGILARRELTTRTADETGIWCVSLSSADWLPVTHGIFLNLAEGALRSVENAPVSAGEGQKIFTDTGWAVGTNDHQELEFELLWFLNRGWRELRLGFAATDFEGRVLTPSRLWMWAAFTNEQLKREPEVPLVTRWDEIQRGTLAQLAAIRELAPARVADLEFALRRDLTTEASSWAPDADVRISASSLERYWTCPFIFAAERKLKLADNPLLDLDLDRRTRGNLLHAVVEALSAEPMRFEWADDELAAVIEACRTREGIRLGEERMWPVVRAQHQKLARTFLDFEREWRGRFPATRTVGREVAFECAWDVDAGGPAAGAGDVRVAGRIDRVDADPDGRLALIDYKASGDWLNWDRWLKNKTVQMALYAHLLEEGLGGLPAGPVVAANFYVIKDRNRRKGFHLRDEGAALYDGAEKHKNFVDPGEKAGMFGELRELITGTVHRLQAGDFNPRPEDPKTCVDCTWRSLCRAPHLN